jgi:toxin ParE1/3/4
MTWNVAYTEDAEQDLQDIFDYISGFLLAPATAEKQTDRIMDAVDSLDNMPFRYRLYDKEPWRSKGLRVLPVDNYAVFYLPDKETQTVSIVRIMHGRRDVEKHLGKPAE